MFSFDSRSTKFINLELDHTGEVFHKGEFKGIMDGKELVHWVMIEVNPVGKVIKRTRRKVWDDLSLRGGQYSAVMILLTAIYSLFQGPFQDMKYGLKFAEMRAMDNLSDPVEQKLYLKVNK